VVLKDDSSQVDRIDRGRFGRVARTPQGGLRVPANLTRVGVFVYTQPDGSKVRELRHPDEVFSADSLATLAGAPVTALHPSTPVRPSNWRDLSVGHVRDDVRADGKFVAANLMIQDADAVSRVTREDDDDPEARRELSCGYSCRRDMSPGEWNGERYDAVQRNIRYNHVALGPKNWGRAGNEVALRLDASGNQIRETPTKETSIMKTIRIDGRDYEIGSDEHLAKLEEMSEAKLAKERARADAAEAERDAAVKERDEVQARLDAATDPSALDERVKERADLVANATRIVGEDFKADGKTDREIMVEAIRHDDDSFEPDEKSDDYVRAFFDARAKTTRRHDEGGTGIGAVRSAAVGGGRKGQRLDDKGQPVTDENRNDAASARDRMIADNAKAASQPLRHSTANN